MALRVSCNLYIFTPISSFCQVKSTIKNTSINTIKVFIINLYVHSFAEALH